MDYGSGWRKEVVNQCLEFEDPSLPDLAPSLDFFNAGMSSGRDRVCVCVCWGGVTMLLTCCIEPHTELTECTLNNR